MPDRLASASIRFIPAHAGNTLFRPLFGPSPPVHPRTCGEYVTMSTRPFFYIRFIPAHAGNTVTPSAPSPVQTVHPRTCGEYALFDRIIQFLRRFIPAHAGNTMPRVSMVSRFHGSSPHMRGILPSVAFRTASIPVHPRTCGEYVTAIPPVRA